jgi:hypothetical protein
MTVWLRDPAPGNVWHVMGPIPAGISRGTTASVCGLTFDDGVRSWPDGEPPIEREQCPTCRAPTPERSTKPRLGAGAAMRASARPTSREPRRAVRPGSGAV